MAKKTVKPAPLIDERQVRALEHLAAFTEKTRLNEYMDLMQRPTRLIWLNFWSGVWRGVGVALGGTIVAALLVFGAVRGLKMAYRNAGGLPWIGAEAKKAVGFVLDAVEQRKLGSGNEE